MALIEAIKIEIIPDVSPEERKAQLDELYTRDKAICFWCKDFVKRDKASREHIVPQSCGGSSDMDNLALAHKSCNTKRGNGFDEFFYTNFKGVTGDKVHIYIPDKGIMVILRKKRDGSIDVVLFERKKGTNGYNWEASTGT